eukprot:2112165-Pyramimonas_sp.AAC.1
MCVTAINWKIVSTYDPKIMITNSPARGPAASRGAPAGHPGRPRRERAGEVREHVPVGGGAGGVPAGPGVGSKYLGTHVEGMVPMDLTTPRQRLAGELGCLIVTINTLVIIVRGGTSACVVCFDGSFGMLNFSTA